MQLAQVQQQLKQLTQLPYNAVLALALVLLISLFLQQVYVAAPDDTVSEREYSLPEVKPLTKPQLSQTLASWREQAISQITPPVTTAEPEGATKLENQHLRIRGTWFNPAKQPVALFEIIENNSTRFAPFTQGELFGFYQVTQIANQQVSLVDTRDPNAEPVTLVVFDPISNRE